MEIVHDFWNKRSSSEDLISLIEQNNSPDFTKEVFISLLKIGSTFSSHDPYIYDYLKSLCLSYPKIFIEILSSDNYIEFGPQLLDLLQSIGPKLLDAFEYDNEVAKCIMHIFQICFQLPNKELSLKSLFDLAQDLKFASLVAYTRTQFGKEFIQSFRIDYQTLIKSSSSSIFSNSLILLNKAILSDSIVDSSFFIQNNLIPFFFSVLIIDQKTNLLSTFLNNASIYQHLCSFINLYFNSPSLFLLHLIVNFVPSIKKQTLSAFLSEPIKDIRHITSANYFYSKEMIESTFVAGAFYDKTSGNIFENLFVHPSSIATFADDLILLVQPENINRLITILPKLESSMNDIILFLSLNEKLIDFLISLTTFCENTSNDKHFQKIWFYLLFLVHKANSLGIFGIRKMINAYLDRISIHSKFFIMTLINYEKPDLDIAIDKADSLIFRCVSILIHILSDPTEKVSAIVNKMQTISYFLPSILLGCIVRPEFNELLQKIHFPISPIISSLLSHLRFIMGNLSKEENSNNRLNEGLFFNPNYTMIMKFPVKDIEDIRTIIQNQLLLIKSSHLDDMLLTPLIDIFTSWKAWLDTFGPTEFVKELFFDLSSLTFSLQCSKEFTPFYINAAYMLYLVCNDNQNEAYPLIFEEIHRQISEVANMGQASGIAHFSHILICLCTENWEVPFNSIYNLSVSILRDTSIFPNHHLQCNFALTFIRKSLLTPLLQNKIVEGPFDFLVACEDYKTLVDYFIVQEKLADMI